MDRALVMVGGGTREKVAGGRPETDALTAAALNELEGVKTADAEPSASVTAEELDNAPVPDDTVNETGIPCAPKPATSVTLTNKITGAEPFRPTVPPLSETAEITFGTGGWQEVTKPSRLPPLPTICPPLLMPYAIVPAP